MKLPKTYEPGKYESDIYNLWEKGRVFVADPHSTKPHFSMAMPPPNETGTLHVGHALFLTLQDIIARHQRQKGKDVLWLPGTDHAAIATNAIIEKQLAEQGTDKHQVGREEFIALVKQFVGNSRRTIISQMRAMGASADWTRLHSTLDDSLNRCVNEVFVKMYNDGLIYRGYRIVNWDPKLETAVSDDEVVYEAAKSPLYTLQYGPFQIATARPETKFGDKYVVMHPEDKRYAAYQHGDTFEAEWINGSVKATVIKDEAIDPSFGTGVMTITPWHDRTDFEIAERHGLEKEPIIGFDGKLLPVAGEFAGMSIDEARPKIVDKLQSKGLVANIDENYSHNVALNSRGAGVIEPQIKLQWFVDVNRPAVDWKGQKRSLKEVMRAVVEDGDIKIIPKRFQKDYFRWIDNLRDWCISRQIWWGHRVPVWYRGTGEEVETYAGVQPPEGQGWQQDEDTLDTWFSSALWTWSTLVDQELAKDYSISLEDLLEKSLDFKTYHPTDVMETGWDILFFWVARMILATTYATGQIPFKTVYIHGLVRTDTGKKMSKSDPDTIVDPMSVIPRYGTDALRLALVSGVTAGNDQRLGEAKIVANRNFANKLWNIARYIEGVSEGAGGNASEPPSPQSPADHWILNKLSISARDISADLDNFRFSEAYERLYHFVWDDLADWYIEASKYEPNVGLLNYVLESTLIIAHPFAPFITEAIWQTLGRKQDSLLATEPWRQPVDGDSGSTAEFETIIQLVSEVRQIISALGAKKPSLYYQNAPELASQAELVTRLAGLGAVKEGVQEPGKGLRLTSTNLNAWLDVERAAAQNYLKKLKGQQRQREEGIARLESRLASQEYVSKAPKELIEQTRGQLQAEKTRLTTLKEEAAKFENQLG